MGAVKRRDAIDHAFLPQKLDRDARNDVVRGPGLPWFAPLGRTAGDNGALCDRAKTHDTSLTGTRVPKAAAARPATAMGCR